MLAEGCIGGNTKVGDTGVVDQDIKTAVFSGHGVVGGLDRGVRGDVELEGLDGEAGGEGGDGGLDFGEGAGAHEDVIGGVFGGEFLGNLEADAGVGAADEDNGFLGVCFGAHHEKGGTYGIGKGNRMEYQQEKSFLKNL